MDPAQFQRQDVSLAQLDGSTDTPISKSFQTPVSAKANGKMSLSLGGGGVGAVPRIDTEPVYTALKAALGEGFGVYREAIAGFVLGNLNQAELSNTLSRLLSPAPSVSTVVQDSKLTSTIHLHNQLLCAIYANTFRDAPPEPIAPWVLAPDDSSAHASNAAKIGAGAGAANEAEERLKREVMALSARDRRRIKTAKDPATDPERDAGPLTESIHYYNALTVPTSKVDAEAALLEGKGSLAKTNWDVEIKRRYAMPLASETLEFPNRSEIQSRIEPICYEEGLGLTASTPMSTATIQACAEYLETATEMFVKEILEHLIAHTRTNGEGMPLTATYKKQLHKEEDAVERGELARNAAGLLPCEAEVAARREQLTTDDLRLSLRLDDCRLVHDPFLADKILSEYDVDPDAYAIATPSDHESRHGMNGLLPNGSLTNGIKEGTALPDGGDPMVVDSEDPDNWGWTGAGQEDRDALMSVLDSALSVGY